MADALRAGTTGGLPRRAHVEVAFFAQADDELCGPAVLSMLLAGGGLHAPLAELTDAVYLPGRHGSLQVEMLAAARRFGAVAFTLPPQLDALCAQVAHGTPVGMLVNLSLPIVPRWHYLVMTGYDLDTGTAWLHSGQQPNAPWPLATLEHTWVRAGAWSFVALPPGQWPVGIDAPEATAAVAAFERAQGAGGAPAGMAWHSAQARWPDALGPMLGLGNWALARGDWPGAVHWLEAAALRHDAAPAWNNLAIARARLGDSAGARDAIEHAERRARGAEPRFLPSVEATRRELGF